MFMKVSILCVNGDLLEFSPAGATIFECTDAVSEFLRRFDHEGSDVSLELRGSITDSEKVYQFLRRPE